LTKYHNVAGEMLDGVRSLYESFGQTDNFRWGAISMGQTSDVWEELLPDKASRSLNATLQENASLRSKGWGTKTNYKVALSKAQEMLEDETHGRPEATKVIILFSDGYPSDLRNVAQVKTFRNSTFRDNDIRIAMAFLPRRMDKKTEKLMRFVTGCCKGNQKDCDLSKPCENMASAATKGKNFDASQFTAFGRNLTREVVKSVACPPVEVTEAPVVTEAPAEVTEEVPEAPAEVTEAPETPVEVTEEPDDDYVVHPEDVVPVVASLGSGDDDEEESSASWHIVLYVLMGVLLCFCCVGCCIFFVLGKKKKKNPEEEEEAEFTVRAIPADGLNSPRFITKQKADDRRTLAGGKNYERRKKTQGPLF